MLLNFSTAYFTKFVFRNHSYKMKVSNTAREIVLINSALQGQVNTAWILLVSEYYTNFLSHVTVDIVLWREFLYLTKYALVLCSLLCYQILQELMWHTERNIESLVKFIGFFLWKRILICVNIISILLWIFIIIIFIYIAIIIVQNNLIHKIHWYIHHITLLTKNCNRI